MEITLEEWPAERQERRQLYGHDGWVAGGDNEEPKEDAGANAPHSQIADAAAADPGQRLRSKVAAKQAAREQQGGSLIVKGKKSGASLSVVGARQVMASTKSSATAKPKRQRDEFALNSEDEDERVQEDEPATHSRDGTTSPASGNDAPKLTGRKARVKDGGEAAIDNSGSAGERAKHDGGEGGGSADEMSGAKAGMFDHEVCQQVMNFTQWQHVEHQNFGKHFKATFISE